MPVLALTNISEQSLHNYLKQVSKLGINGFLWNITGNIKEREKEGEEGGERFSTLYLNHNLVTATLIVSAIKCLKDIIVFNMKYSPTGLFY